jgi:hypothetical protein
MILHSEFNAKTNIKAIFCHFKVNYTHDKLISVSDAVEDFLQCLEEYMQISEFCRGGFDATSGSNCGSTSGSQQSPCSSSGSGSGEPAHCDKSGYLSCYSIGFQKDRTIHIPVVQVFIV